MFAFHQVLKDWRSVKFDSYDIAFFFLTPFLVGSSHRAIMTLIIEDITKN